MNAAGKNGNRAKSRWGSTGSYSTPQKPEPHLPRSHPACPEWHAGMADSSFFTTEAKRLSFFFIFSLLHDGQTTRVSARTKSSKEFLHSPHMYSNIGMSC
jgi:hypothetical protein